MVAFNKVNALSEHLPEKVHNLASDTLKIALCAAANAPVATNSLLGDLTEISYTNLSSRTLSQTSSSQSSGLYKLIVSDLVLSASGGAAAAFRYPVVYNDTPTSPLKPLLGWYDYGSSLTLGDGESLTFDFDGTNGILQIQ